MMTDAEEMVLREKIRKERMQELWVVAATNALGCFLGVTIGLYTLWSFTQPSKPVQHLTEAQIDAMK